VDSLDALIQALVSCKVLIHEINRETLAQSPDGPLRTLHRLGLADEKKAAVALANYLKIPFIDLDTPTFNLSRNITMFHDRVDRNVCWRDKIIPLIERNGYVAVACANPFERDGLRTLEFTLGCPVREGIAEEAKILRLLGEYIPPVTTALTDVSYPELEEEVEIVTTADTASQHFRKAEDQKAIVKLCSTIILRAVREGASDIHLEPLDRGVDVRHRIDGVMQDVIEIPKRLQNNLVARFKVLAGMDISERRRPQDGRIRARVDHEDIDLRVSTVPASFGEKIVMRILRSDGDGLAFSTLGLSAEIEKRIVRILRGNGKLFLTTGPTGSGKTTTLYTCIASLRDGTRNIETVEDPVEFRMSGVNQIQVNESIGVTFASSLRSVLRQDPDVIMVGEIRDEETAQIAIQAGQTGHLVVSSLHTNDAPSAIPRLLNLKIEPYSLASGLAGVLAQRLVRRLCSSCKEVDTNIPDDTKHYLTENGIKHLPTIYRARGCRECGDTGYRGRSGLFSFLEITPSLADLIANKVSLGDLIRQAKLEGFQTLEDAARLRLCDGLTSLEQVRDYFNRPTRSLQEEFQPLGTKEGGVASSARPPTETFNQATLSREAAPSPSLLRRSSGIQIQKSRILVVDDDPDVRALFTSVLEKNLYEVVQAYDGLDGLERVYEASPDLVLCDLMMPRMDGRQFLLRMRERLETKAIPIIILTAASTDDNEVGLLELGASDFIAKESSYQVILSRVRRLLNFQG
jgi:type II secretory ATPase GspE/PulE/Tfp pilus assembly ATPase PilB-like protein